MSRYDRINAPQPKTANKRRRQKRFALTSLAVLDPRKLTAAKSGSAGAKTTTGSTESIQGVGKKRERDRLWHGSHVLAVLLMLAAFGFFIYAFLTPNFYIYRADVENARYTSAAQVFTTAKIDRWSIFFLNPTVIAERVAQLPHVRSADVSLSLPARVRIILQEREPVLLYQVQAERFWVDAEGAVAPAADDRQNLLKLVDDDTGAKTDSTHLDTTLLLAIQNVSRNLPQVTTYRYQAPYGLFFISPEGWRVYLGSAERMEMKLAIWNSIRKRLLDEQLAVQEIDLRYEHPYWR